MMGLLGVTMADLKQIAEKIGIDVIGATSARPFEEILPTLQLYYEEGRSSGFEHAFTRERIDPMSILPEAKSLISIAISYVTKETKEIRRPKGKRGMVSVYSWGQDYHQILHEKLNQLEKELEQLCGRSILAKSCVDTGPLVDRAVAARAGVGFVGKNCCVITPTHGSWVFLGTLVTDVEVVDASEQVSASECGDCDLCLQACPTGALLEPGVIDSKQCLSYITQSKGTIPEHLRDRLGRRVWGCDTCQTVCPKNSVSLLGIEERFNPDPELSYPELTRILTMSRKSFMREFGKTAAAWRGANVWRRNALIALGNMRDKGALSLVLSFLEDERPEMRASAAWALRQIDPEASRTAVLAAYAREEDEEVKRDLMWALREDDE